LPEEFTLIHSIYSKSEIERIIKNYIVEKKFFNKKVLVSKKKERF